MFEKEIEEAKQVLKELQEKERIYKKGMKNEYSCPTYSNKDEIYTELFTCDICGDTYIMKWSKFCPNCGKPIKWE